MTAIQREVIAFMESWDDASALCKSTKDKFYLSAFSIECWLGKLGNSTVAQYPEERSANRRRLQVGESRRIFAEVFKHTNDRDFSSLFVYLARFANADGPYSYALRQSYWAISEEGEFPPKSGAGAASTGASKRRTAHPGAI